MQSSSSARASREVDRYRSSGLSVTTHGQQVLNRIDFARGLIYPSFQVNASAGADPYRSDRVQMRLQADGQNLDDVLDVIDFGGLFSGNAIGPSWSYSLRLTANSNGKGSSGPDRLTLIKDLLEKSAHR
jgi:hypothetical protein